MQIRLLFQLETFKAPGKKWGWGCSVGDKGECGIPFGWIAPYAHVILPWSVRILYLPPPLPLPPSPSPLLCLWLPDVPNERSHLDDVPVHAQS